MIYKTICMFLLATAIGLPSFAQTKEERIALSKTNENHQLLASISGNWTFIGKHFPPNTQPIEFKGTAERKAIMGGRYFTFETIGKKLKMPWSDKEETYRDMAIEGYDNLKKKFFSAMVENHWTTGIHTTEGTYDAATKTFRYEGEIGKDGTKMKFFNLVKLLDADHYVFEAYGHIGGKDVKMSEINYTRVNR